jgi:hypothetical protein
LEWAELLDLSVVPELYRGVYDEDKIKTCYTGQSKYEGIQEGYVVRVSDSFRLEEFEKSYSKMVRKHHITTDEHWMKKQIEVNGRRIKEPK